MKTHSKIYSLSVFTYVHYLKYIKTSKSGGFQLPKIEAVSSQIWVESPDSMYFDWALTQYIQKGRHSEIRVGTVKIVSTFKKSVFCPIIYLWDPIFGLVLR